MRAAILFMMVFAVVAIPDFLEPLPATYAENADLMPATVVHDAAGCAAICRVEKQCISFNVCVQPNGDVECGIQGWNVSYVLASAASCTYYRRAIPRNDTRIAQSIQWKLSVPQSGVRLVSGPILEAFNENLAYLRLRDPLDMLHFFAKRGGHPEVGKCFGWDGWIEGSAGGNYMMGAGNALRFVDDPELDKNLKTVVAGIRDYRDASGYAFAFDEKKLPFNNLPDYCASWVTRGLLAAHEAGIPAALDVARGVISYFNNHSSLPTFLPPNGGEHPVQPFPAGFNNVTSGGLGQPSGHMIYIQFQGMIKHTLMALSEAGTQADADIIAEHYQEDWWLEGLRQRDVYHALWHRQFFSHNYEITAFEAFLDMYVLTGNETYLDACMGAWEMLREHYILTGGSIALNEIQYYPPGSYYIGFTGRNIGARSKQEEAEGEDMPYFHSKCMLKPLQGRTEAMAPEVEGQDPPTGELCGSVFWTLFNQRFHRLFPENETFVWEMERSILNVGLAAISAPSGSGGQGPDGQGIRYFANQHKQKQFPSMHASCCEGQGTRLFGMLPEFLFTTAPGSVRVDIYAHSTFTFQHESVDFQLSVNTKWPYGSNVSIDFIAPLQASFEVILRIPSWTAAKEVSILVGGHKWGSQAVGRYAHIKQVWPKGTTTITFDLPMKLAAYKYTGSTQIKPYTRYSYTYGPVLLAAQGPWDDVNDAIVFPKGIDPASPHTWTEQSLSNSLHFNVTHSNFTLVPYFEIQDVDAMFSVYPCFS